MYKSIQVSCDDKGQEKSTSEPHLPGNSQIISVQQGILPRTGHPRLVAMVGDTGAPQKEAGGFETGTDLRCRELPRENRR